jgi:hypothetical protein
LEEMILAHAEAAKNKNNVMGQEEHRPLPDFRAS